MLAPVVRRYHCIVKPWSKSAWSEEKPIIAKTPHLVLGPGGGRDVFIIGLATCGREALYPTTWDAGGGREVFIIGMAPPTATDDPSTLWGSATDDPSTLWGEEDLRGSSLGADIGRAGIILVPI